MSSIASGDPSNYLLAAASDYARRGFRVMPLHEIAAGKCSCGKLTCKKPGKHPRTQHGCKDATTDETTLRSWWSAWPSANVGLATGPGSGFFMIGPDGQAGIDALADLQRQHGELPLTVRVASGGGGRHYYFRWPSVGTVQNAINHSGVPIDVRGAGGLVVAPPSHHTSGMRYTWEVGLDEVSVASAPEWLLEWLRIAKRTPQNNPQTVAEPLTPTRNGGVRLTVKADGRPDPTQRALAYLHRCAPAVSGQGGHARTFEVARAVVYGFDLGPEAGFQVLAEHYNPRCVPPWSEAELRHKCADADGKPFDKPRGYLLHEQEYNRETAARAPDTVATPGVGEDIEGLPMPPPAPWPALPGEALYGLSGEIVTTLAPETESDPVAILGQLLVAFGSAVGRGPHYLVEGDGHHANLFLCLVGESSRGRKGTSRGRVVQLMTQADADWCRQCVAGGLSSGEGLVWAVRDQITKKEPIKEKGRITGYQEVVADEGVADKRLLVDESEFAQVLKMLQREGNSLSPVIRQAWDTGRLRMLTKNSPARATDAHISISAHITKPELVKLLKDTEALNGFANRYLWLAVRRSRLLPDGGRALDLSPLGVRLNYALASARGVGRMARSVGAAALWHDLYPRLTAERPGLYGAVTGRAEAQVLRLSMVYSLLDGRAEIDVPHLRAALALWSYADASARLIFGAEAEDPLPGLVLAKLREAPGGLTRTGLHDAFGRNLPAGQLLAALANLRDRGEAYAVKVETGGRPSEHWCVRRTNEETKKGSEPPGSDPLSSFSRSFVSDEPDGGADDSGEVVEL
jgi:hypothetical protein